MRRTVSKAINRLCSITKADKKKLKKLWNRTAKNKRSVREIERAIMQAELNRADQLAKEGKM